MGLPDPNPSASAKSEKKEEVKEEAKEEGKEGVEKVEEKEPTTMELLMTYIFKNPAIWALGISYFFVYAIRQGFVSWSHFYVMDMKVRIHDCFEDLLYFDLMYYMFVFAGHHRPSSSKKKPTRPSSTRPPSLT